MTPSPSLFLSPSTAVKYGRAFSSGSTPGEGEASAATAAAVDDAKVRGDFPWRTAPDQFVEPAASRSFLDGTMDAIFHDFFLKGVDFSVSWKLEHFLRMRVAGAGVDGIYNLLVANLELRHPNGCVHHVGKVGHCKQH